MTLLFVEYQESVYNHSKMNRNENENENENKKMRLIMSVKTMFMTTRWGRGK